MKDNKIDSTNINNEISKKNDGSFEAYFNKVSDDLRMGHHSKDSNILDCVGSWVERNDFSRFGS